MVDIDAAALAVKDLLGAFGVPTDDHTEGTPLRSAKAWSDVLSGYREDPADHLEVTFSAPDDPGQVILAGVQLQSMCAHHLLPFTGMATVAYRPSPGDRVVGLSKLSRVVQGYARRLQVQERIGADTVDAIMARLRPAGAVVLITASHDCMRLRGAQEPHSATTTIASKGLVLPHEWDAVHRAHWSAYDTHR
ncbi:GTP cyclohydrolase I [Mycobacterium phage Lephleur]|uniref:GTP cyclohydrolase I n=1 Tax=Mycobacterium phage Lephleur TaxID=2686234 RepID=A0A6B9L896_9CAUD|nr:GTP cyclohydrolase I [Mycobacterium phage Lephleur]